MGTNEPFGVEYLGDAKPTKDVTEAELKQAAVAPRVTEEDLNANIVAEYTFTAADAIYEIGAAPEHTSLALLTIAVVVLKNGFTVMGQSACASPENFNPEIGRRLAIADAKNKIWSLMGYALREQLHMVAENAIG